MGKPITAPTSQRVAAMLPKPKKAARWERQEGTEPGAGQVPGRRPLVQTEQSPGSGPG